jgi:hypothetical protein
MKCSLDLSRLFTTGREREAFEVRFSLFLESDPYNREVYELAYDRLVFWSEQLIPVKKDNRIPLLMVFGNPAPRSVSEGMFFAYEGEGKEHRFWKHIVKPAGLLDFSLDAGLSVRERNERRKKQLLDLEYRSAFRVGFTVFITLPSGSSGPWSGNAGIRKLLGARAMRNLIESERARVSRTTGKFIGDGGIVLTFQRDAWEGLRSPKAPPYCIHLAKQGKLAGTVIDKKGCVLYGLPPTRLTGPCRRVLAAVIAGVSKEETNNG